MTRVVKGNPPLGKVSSQEDFTLSGVLLANSAKFDDEAPMQIDWEKS